jgi:hypothetical protein
MMYHPFWMHGDEKLTVNVHQEDIYGGDGLTPHPPAMVSFVAIPVQVLQASRDALPTR